MFFQNVFLFFKNVFFFFKNACISGVTGGDTHSLGANFAFDSESGSDALVLPFFSCGRRGEVQASSHKVAMNTTGSSDAVNTPRPASV